MKALRAFKSQTREGFRLLLAWLAGFLCFYFLSGLSQILIPHFEPLYLLLAIFGVGFIALAGAVLLEGLKRPAHDD